MSAAALLDELFDPLARCLNADAAQRVADLRVSPIVQERVDWLAQRANEGTLTEDERNEYEALINASDFIAILKSKATRSLQPNISR